jgi:hypothetical protein
MDVADLDFDSGFLQGRVDHWWDIISAQLHVFVPRLIIGILVGSAPYLLLTLRGSVKKCSADTGGDSCSRLLFSKPGYRDILRLHSYRGKCRLTGRRSRCSGRNNFTILVWDAIGATVGTQMWQGGLELKSSIRISTGVVGVIFFPRAAIAPFRRLRALDIQGSQKKKAPATPAGLCLPQIFFKSIQDI